jgi:hypothetical protein
MHGAHIPLALSHCHFNEHVQPPLHHMIAFELVLSHAAAAVRLLTKNKQTGELNFSLLFLRRVIDGGLIFSLRGLSAS